MIEIFDIDQKRLTINPAILDIPELKAIVDEYEDYMTVISYIAYLTDPTTRNPYGNFVGEGRKNAVLADFPPESYSPTDKLVCDAIEKMEVLNETVINKYYKQMRILMTRLGTYAATAVIDDSREGNIATLRGLVKDMGSTMKQYAEAEKQKLEEEKKLRGNKKFAYDQQ